MIQIIPAVMPESLDDLVDKIGLVPKSIRTIQIDVMDGVFVPSKSWPYKKDDGGHFEKMSLQDEGFPQWEDFDFSLDLMVSNPETEVEKFISAGASEVIIHLESLGDSGLSFITSLKDRGVVKIGIAISTKTEINELEQYLPYINIVQFMGIERVGFQGEEFVPSVLDKIKELRSMNSDIDISVDGGVNFDNARDIVEAGANILVSGSVLFEDGVQKGIMEFKEVISE